MDKSTQPEGFNELGEIQVLHRTLPTAKTKYNTPALCTTIKAL